MLNGLVPSTPLYCSTIIAVNVSDFNTKHVPCNAPYFIRQRPLQNVWILHNRPNPAARGQCGGGILRENHGDEAESGLTLSMYRFFIVGFQLSVIAEQFRYIEVVFCLTSRRNVGCNPDYDHGAWILGQETVVVFDYPNNIRHRRQQGSWDGFSTDLWAYNHIILFNLSLMNHVGRDYKNCRKIILSPRRNYSVGIQYDGLPTRALFMSSSNALSRTFQGTLCYENYMYRNLMHLGEELTMTI